MSNKRLGARGLCLLVLGSVLSIGCSTPEAQQTFDAPEVSWSSYVDCLESTAQQYQRQCDNVSTQGVQSYNQYTGSGGSTGPTGSTGSTGFAGNRFRNALGKTNVTEPTEAQLREAYRVYLQSVEPNLGTNERSELIARWRSLRDL